MVSVEAGSEIRNERHKRHLAFSGAYVLQRYGKSGRSRLILRRRWTGLGRNQCFHESGIHELLCKSEKENVNEILDVVADMYLNPTFDSRKSKKKKASLSRSSIYTDTPSPEGSEPFMNLVYGNQPAGWDILGRKEVIRSITRNDFMKYRAGNTTCLKPRS